MVLRRSAVSSGTLQLSPPRTEASSAASRPEPRPSSPPPTAPEVGHDIIVIGASSGGVEALLELVAGLPEDLPASIFIVLHTSPAMQSPLPELLSHRGRLHAMHAIHGEAIQRGRIYVAPPDNHLLVRPGLVEVVRGPKENNHRPSVDALFRSAAKAYGPRVIGVVLTGHLDCGTAGMLSIKARNGLSVVQDPREAQAPAMPHSVMQHVEVDHVVPIKELAPLLARLAEQPAGPPPKSLPPALLELEGDQLGLPVSLVCPLCDGALTAGEMNGFQLFRCHVGHAFSPESIVAEQDEQVERCLWAAVRALEETAGLADRLGRMAAGSMRQQYQERAADRQAQAHVLRETLLRERGQGKAQ